MKAHGFNCYFKELWLSHIIAQHIGANIKIQLLLHIIVWRDYYILISALINHMLIYHSMHF